MKLHSLQQIYAITISNITVEATPTVTTDNAHGFTSGESVTLAGVNSSLTGGANAAHIVTVTGDKTFTIPITTGGTYSSAGDTATKDVAGLLHGHAFLGIFQSFGVAGSGMGTGEKCRLIVETTNLPGVGEEFDISAWGRVTQASEWILLAFVDESTTPTFRQQSGSGLFTHITAELMMMPEVAISSETTASSSNSFRAGIVVDK